MEKNELTASLLSRASALAAEYYGCGLDRLDPEELAFYTEQVTPATLEDVADGLAAAAWQAY